MARLISGTPCSICREALQAGEALVSTSHFIADPQHHLWRFSDSGMHRRCFLEWTHRDEFVRLYNETVGGRLWGNGQQQIMRPDGTIDSVPMDGFAIATAAAGRWNQDRTTVVSLPEGHLLALADGAGGTTGGTAAAEAVIGAAWSLTAASVEDCVSLLRDLDRRLAGEGETTAVLVVALHDQVWGASVGDSGAWMVGDTVVDLTEGQKRKPLIGTGNATPVGFGPCKRAGRLLLGSDGLFKYVQADRIPELARGISLTDAAASLVDAARLPSGALQDDITVILGE